MIPLAAAIGLWASQALLDQPKPIVEPAFDRATCAPRPKVALVDAGSATVEALLRLDEPRFQECLLEAQLRGGGTMDVTLRVRGGTHPRFDVSGELTDFARGCVTHELQSLFVGARIPESIDASTRFRRAALVTVHHADCTSVDPSQIRKCRLETAGIQLADALRSLAPESCECFAKISAIPATVGVKVDMRGRSRLAFVFASDDVLAPTPASECLKARIARHRFDGVTHDFFDLGVDFTVIDSDAATASEAAAPDLRQMQATARVEREQAGVLLAVDHRQRAFEQLDARIDQYDRNLSAAATNDASAMNTVKQRASELEPIHSDCLALVKADDDLIKSMSVLIDELGKGLELNRVVGLKDDDWKQELGSQTEFRSTVGQERAKHSTECDEIAKAAREGLIVTRTAALAMPRKPSARDLFRKLSKDIERQDARKVDASEVDSRGLVHKR